ncbi:AfsR/SARP family transcriptional regulator [Ornithinimicrobium sp.]|uniref:AfsR/SARP family transcriptional regulator n=1 Tax=Ornithinimicrobium sp. TaxID=1977084 RepID=UPI003D9B6C01
MGRSEVAMLAGETPYRIEVLGHFDLRVPGHQQIRLSAQAQRLVAAVAVRDRVSREQIAAILWPDYDDAAALGRVRDVLYRIRGAAPGLLVGHGHQVCLGHGVDVDLHRARCHAVELTAASGAGLCDTALGAGGTAAAALLTSRLLPGWPDEWLAADKRSFAMLRLRALEDAARHWLARGHYGPAEQAALAAIQVEPYRETTRLLLAQIYAAEGNSAQALRSLTRFGRQLRRELGVPPSGEIQQFACSLQQSDPGQPVFSLSRG